MCNALFWVLGGSGEGTRQSAPMCITASVLTLENPLKARVLFCRTLPFKINASGSVAARHTLLCYNGKNAF